MDNLLIVIIGGIVACAIFIVFEFIAKYFDWD
jgi:hypothetical protein